MSVERSSRLEENQTKCFKCWISGTKVTRLSLLSFVSQSFYSIDSIYTRMPQRRSLLLRKNLSHFMTRLSNSFCRQTVFLVDSFTRNKGMTKKIVKFFLSPHHEREKLYYAIIRKDTRSESKYRSRQQAFTFYIFW